MTMPVRLTCPKLSQVSWVYNWVPRRRFAGVLARFFEPAVDIAEEGAVIVAVAVLPLRALGRFNLLRAITIE